MTAARYACADRACGVVGLGLEAPRSAGRSARRSYRMLRAWNRQHHRAHGLEAGLDLVLPLLGRLGLDPEQLELDVGVDVVPARAEHAQAEERHAGG